MRASLTVTICLAATLAIPASLATDGRVLEILLMGDIYPCPAIVLGLIDPAFEYTPVQTREIPEDQARRYVRLYFPRSAEALTHYAAIFFVDADMSPFSGPQVGAMLDAVAEGQVGTFWTFGPHYGSVASSALSVVVPHEMSANFNSWAWGHSFYRVTFRRDRPPVFTPFIELGVEDVRAYGCGQISPRRGTVIWGDLIPFPWPWMVSWRFGGDGGLCWAAADDLDHPWWSRETYGFSENKYAVDVLANIVSYTAGRQLPEDIMIPIKIRRELFDYAGAKNLFISTLEFVEKFGADTGPLYEELLDFEERIVEPAKEAYLMGSYAEALETIGAANEEVIRLVDLALEQRKRALFWIFLVEWLVVSGTSMITGTVVWTLMVRRKVYREVGRTRLISD